MVENLKTNHYVKEYLDDGRLLLSFDNGKRVRVTPIVEEIIKKFDGTKSINKVKNELNNEGFEISESELEDLINNRLITVSYTHLTLPTIAAECRSRWSPYH